MHELEGTRLTRRRLLGNVFGAAAAPHVPCSFLDVEGLSRSDPRRRTIGARRRKSLQPLRVVLRKAGLA